MTPGPARLAVTLGDPRGIGPEIVAKALVGLTGVSITLIGADDQINGIPADHRVSVGSWKAGSGARPEDRPRVVRAGQLAGHAVERAAALAMTGQVDAIVTAPLEKHALHVAGFRYPGHTEWLAHLAGDVEVAMMLAADRLRVVLVTTHVAFRDVPALLTTDRVVRTGKVTIKGFATGLGSRNRSSPSVPSTPMPGSRGYLATRRPASWRRPPGRSAPRARFRPTRSLSEPCGENSMPCLLPITTSG